MESNNIFSIRRFFMLIRQSLIFNKKIIGITVVGLIGSLFLLLLLFQSTNHFVYWNNRSYMVMFIIFFFSLGILWSSFSFPAFRTKEKSMSYLLLPATRVEKYTYELVSRLVVFLVLFPLLYWVVANIEGIIVHQFIPRLGFYKFSYTVAFDTFVKNNGVPSWHVTLLSVQVILISLVVPFTGATFFRKAPLLKTVFTLALVMGGLALFTFLLFKIFHLKEYGPPEEGILFIHNEHQVLSSLAIAATVINLALLAMAWFRLKEKEV